jgi:UPF0042 nucleotide-binding protein
MSELEGRLVIITGMSGAGKSSALRCFEDLGYCCIDNIPPTLIPTFLQLYNQTPQSISNIAIVCDVRSGELFGSFKDVMEQLRHDNLDYQVLFLDCDDDELIRRFKEARRLPPLALGLRLEEAVMLERQRLEAVKELATITIDTSNLEPEHLRNRLLGMFAGERSAHKLTVNLLSFGFKFGVPQDADFVFDTRFLNNPFYEEHLKDLSGDDEPVREYVMNSSGAREYFDAILTILTQAVPAYRDVHKFSTVIAVGCTGGRHRSVTYVNLLGDRLRADGYRVSVQHRDLGRI